MSKPAKNYVKLTVRSSRDLSDFESVRRPPKPDFNGQYITDWVFPFDGSASGALSAWALANRKREILKRTVIASPSAGDRAGAGISISIYRALAALSVPEIGRLKQSHLGVVA